MYFSFIHHDLHVVRWMCLKCHGVRRSYYIHQVVNLLYS